MNSLTIPQLAEKLGVSRVTVYNRVKKGEIPAERVGRNYVISARTAEQLLPEVMTPEKREWIDRTVRMVVRQYGGVLKQLSRE